MTSMIDDAVRADVRAFVESNMLGAVSITRPPTQVLDPDTLIAANSPGEPVYTGKARVKPTSYAMVETGEGPIAQITGTVSIPYGSADVQVDDVLVVTAAEDARLVGKAFHVDAATGGGIFADKIEIQVSTWAKSSRWTGAT